MAIWAGREDAPRPNNPTEADPKREKRGMIQTLAEVGLCGQYSENRGAGFDEDK